MTQPTETDTSIPEEWLSAYLDGELTSNETAQVETALAESPTLRAQLAELRSVSELLKSLPQPTLPQNLAASLPLDRPVRRQAGLNWRLGAVTSSLVAASLVAGVLWFQSDTGDFGNATMSSSPEIADSSERFGTMPTDDMAVASGDVEPNSPLAAPAEPVIASSGRLAVTSDDMTAMPSSASETLPQPSALPQPGALISTLEEVDGELAIVEFVVTDVRESVDDFMLSLTRAGVRHAASVDERYGRLDDDESTGQVFAVFVQADESAMQAIFDQTHAYATGGQSALAMTRARMSVPSAPVRSTPVLEESATDGVRDLDMVQLKAHNGYSIGPLVTVPRQELAAGQENATTGRVAGANLADDNSALAYQVPLQLSESSVQTIYTNNGFIPTQNSVAISDDDKPAEKVQLDARSTYFATPPSAYSDNVARLNQDGLTHGIKAAPQAQPLAKPEPESAPQSTQGMLVVFRQQASPSQ